MRLGSGYDPTVSSISAYAYNTFIIIDEAIAIDAIAVDYDLPCTK